jgi:ABC-type transporter Mla subunit MlaD
MKNPNAAYYRLGIFVLVGIFLAIVLTVVFSSGKLFNKTYVVETYVEGSVTGLDVGASVRYRGVRVGKVKSIQLSSALYEVKLAQLSRHDYVVVRMELEEEQIKESDIEDLIAKDLRTQMKSQGLTGVNYIELNVIKDTSNFPVLEYEWRPSNPVIPSIPSQTDIVIGAVQKAINAVDALNLEDTKQQLEILISNMNLLIAGDNKKNPGLIATVTELDNLLVSVNKLSSNPEIGNVIKHTADSALLVRNRLSSGDNDTQMTLNQLKIMAEQLNDLSRQLSRNPSGAILGPVPAKIQIPSNVNSGVNSPTEISK